jgi:hypothetical protein
MYSEMILHIQIYIFHLKQVYETNREHFLYTQTLIYTSINGQLVWNYQQGKPCISVQKIFRTAGKHKLLNYNSGSSAKMYLIVYPSMKKY